MINNDFRTKHFIDIYNQNIFPMRWLNSIEFQFLKHTQSWLTFCEGMRLETLKSRNDKADMISMKHHCRHAVEMNDTQPLSQPLWLTCYSTVELSCEYTAHLEATLHTPTVASTASLQKTRVSLFAVMANVCLWWSMKLTEAGEKRGTKQRVKRSVFPHWKVPEVVLDLLDQLAMDAFLPVQSLTITHPSLFYRHFTCSSGHCFDPSVLWQRKEHRLDTSQVYRRDSHLYGRITVLRSPHVHVLGLWEAAGEPAVPRDPSQAQREHVKSTHRSPGPCCDAFTQWQKVFLSHPSYAATKYAVLFSKTKGTQWRYFAIIK